MNVLEVFVVIIGGTAVYVTVKEMVPPSKRFRGLITRKVLLKVPPRRWWKRPSAAERYRWWIVAAAMFPIGEFIRFAPFMVAFYTVHAVLFADDYFNGDDDERRRRWEAIRNKIRWKMPVQAPPVPRSGTA